MKNLRDPKVWLYLFSFAKLVFAASGYDLAPEQWALLEELVNAACGVAVAFGIFKYNPAGDK